MGEEVNSGHIVVMGGSAGSYTPLVSVLKRLSPGFSIPIIIVLHRLRNVESEIDKLLSMALGRDKIKEPEDKENIQPGYIYLAPRNYHLLVEENGCFGLDYSELVDYSRPSINITMQSVASVYQENVTGVLLSGANSDGASGLLSVSRHGGTAIVQSPATCEYATMPQAALNINTKALILSPEKIAVVLNGLSAKI
ncbi:chemotaxis protein CheB [Foetidibacter luteolus]|uniref:chemotaxis protein CheB n=1 Tax=Foetidibacter luteolus TaxID=2608880 RepID=UPI00129A37CE|nr:chemotaxis protein CheB [Foetidibacter luteolus]